MNYRMIAYILGWILIFEAFFMALPIIIAVVYGEAALYSFLAAAGLCLVIGKLLTIKKPENKRLYSREGGVIAALGWIVLSLFGALPFYFSREIPSFIDALFESVSGFTTTGATTLAAVEPLSNSILLWRGFTNWVGGMGVLVLLMAFLPLSGAQNMHIMKAESPGPSVSKLVPKVKTTAMLLYGIYFTLTLTEFIILMVSGMSPFEAVNAAFSTAGTGGFGVKNDSMGGYTPAMQIIITVFMILFSINFNSYYLLISGKIKDALNFEVRLFLIIVIVSSLLISVNVSHMFSSFGEGLRHSAFTVASIISTTGFSTVNFDIWPEFSRTIIVLLMFIGACAGSTGGGIKVSRIIILFKGLKKEMLSFVHPKQVRKVKVDSHTIDHSVIRSVNVYMVSYLLIFVMSLIIVSFDNHDLITNFTAVAATINNIGPGLELVGPAANFGVFSTPAKIVLIFDMLAGRLELFPMLLLLTPETWKK